MSRIFISHAGEDSAYAERVASVLTREGLTPLLDRATLVGGDSFLHFMEQALTTSDFCLLLWSASAAKKSWVRIEWEAALSRSVEEARAFLTVGRLDEHPLPTLLKPRLFVLLHPEVVPGIDELVLTWRRDRRAEQMSERVVGRAPGTAGAEPGSLTQTVYVTSNLFGMTAPWVAKLSAPAGVLLDDVRRQVGLPDVMDHATRIGIRFEYHLAFEDRRLDRSRSLADQGVEHNGVVWLEAEMTPFAATAPEAGTLTTAVFRSASTESTVGEAKQFLLSRITAAGLGFRRPRQPSSGSRHAT